MNAAVVGAVRDVVRRVLAAILWIRYTAPRPVRWLLADPQRLLTVAWLVGILVVGTARAASADPIVVGPDLAQGAPRTLYESYDFSDYKLTVKPDEENSDWFGVSEAVLEVVGFINNLILWACLGLLFGALSLLEWFLNLTVYRDSAPEIDTATQMIATQVFWPLIAATVAVGAFISYARWRGEGRGFLSDFGWVVAAGVLAVGFAAGPSTLMNSVDSVRQELATGVMSGSSAYATQAGNPTGFPTPQIGGDPQKAATRKLVDAVWNTYGATTWCFAEFHDLDICQVAGAHALAGDQQWKDWMAQLDNGGAPPEFGTRVHWIRGQDMTRTGYLLVLALITIPMGFILLRLVIAGLVAVVGFLLMLVIGLLFLVLWPIPGWFRQLGTRYWIYTLGMEGQALVITVIISGTTVTSTIIATQIGKYGFFVVALMNLGLFVAAMRARAWLEALTTLGGAGAMGFATVLLLRSAARTVAGGVRGVVGGGVGLARAGLGGLVSNPRPGMRLPGFKEGNWRPSRFGLGKTAPPEETGVSPEQATATRLRPPGPGTDLVRYRPGLRIDDGRDPWTAYPHQRTYVHDKQAGIKIVDPRLGRQPTVVDKTDPLIVRSARAQDKLPPERRTGRVWVDIRGEGLSAVDIGPAPAPRVYGGSRRITTADWPQSSMKPRHPGGSR
jgi:hypothetical protein